MNENLANRCVDMHCHYFHAGRLHHLDEEQGLFPLLVNQSRLFDGMVDLLIQDHEEIEADWDPLASMLADPEHITDPKEFLELARAFEKRQREHLIRENEDLLPRLEELLTSEQRQQAGEAMAKLRKLMP
jgi:hemerythrin-like domain-containing protein